MITTSKWLGFMAAAFVAGTFIASPELRVYAANTVFSGDIVDGQVKTADLAGNAVTSAKIKDGEVRVADIAADSVGGSELIGVTKMLFGQCAADSNEGTVEIDPNELLDVHCTISGVDSDDSAIAEVNTGNFCFGVKAAVVTTNEVVAYLRNDCFVVQTFLTGSKIAVIVFDK